MAKIGIDRQSCWRLSPKLYARGKAGHKGLIKNAVVIGSLGVVVIQHPKPGKACGQAKRIRKFVLVGHKRPELEHLHSVGAGIGAYMKC